MVDPRYLKNVGLFGEDGIARLRASRAIVVGAGGLGGTLFEILVRAGVGRIAIIDFDRFEASNLNRQLLSTEENLGTFKVQAAVDRARRINAAVEVVAIAERLTDANAREFIRDADLVCDCLGNIHARFVLARAASAAGIPMVHAAIAGTTGQILTILPGDLGLEAIYGSAAETPDAGAELEQGTPSSAVIAVAAMQAHEALAILAGFPPTLRGTLLRVDLRTWGMQRIRIV